MSTRFANFLSVILHPLLMPTLLFGILLFQVPNVLNLDVYPNSFRLSLLVLIFVGTCMVPSLLIFYLLRMGYIRNLQLTDLADRRVPYFLTAFVYFVVAYLFTFQMKTLSILAPEIGILTGSIAMSILLVAAISLSWQISAHTVGIGGILGVIGSLMLKYGITDLFMPLTLLILLTGLVASARLKLNAHTPTQIAAGLVLGVSVGLLTVYWFV